MSQKRRDQEQAAIRLIEESHALLDQMLEKQKEKDRKKMEEQEKEKEAFRKGLGL